MVIPSIPYQEIKDLYNLAARYWGKLSQERRIEQLRQAHKSREDPRLYEFLRWKYRGNPILEWCGRMYPVVVFPAPKHQQYAPESALSHPLLKELPKPETFAARDPTFRALIEKIGIPIQNRLTYTMIQLDTEDTLRLTCSLGRYFYNLDTCHSREWEILSNLDTLGGLDNDSFKRFDSQLKLRNALHEKVDNPILDGDGRSAAIGVSTLIAYNDNGKMQLWVKRRSRSQVAVHSGLVHVVPSFMFQPVTMYIDDEFNIRHNIFREYLEEVFDKPEPEAGEEEVYNYFYCDPRLERLAKLIGMGEAWLLFTGIAVDLLTLRPEICTMLWIKTSDWFNYHSRSVSEDRFKLNLEFARGYEDAPESLVTSVPFYFDDSKLSGYDYLTPSRFSPPGAAAFWLGLNLLREIL